MKFSATPQGELRSVRDCGCSTTGRSTPMRKQNRPFPRSVAILAIAFGIAGGSYGIASAASGSSTSNSSSASGQAAQRSEPNGGAPWGHQRSDETLLTDATESKVRDAATGKLPRATIIRVETDA